MKATAIHSEAAFTGTCSGPAGAGLRGRSATSLSDPGSPPPRPLAGTSRQAAAVYVGAQIPLPWSNPGHADRQDPPSRPTRDTEQHVVTR